jgi:Cu/Ag efflux protein CusF
MMRDKTLPTPVRFATGVVLFALVSGLTLSSVMLTGCEKTPATPASTGFQNPERYITRGVIEDLPDPKRIGTPDLMIQHERIAEFKDLSGKVVGMNSMIMDFPLGPGVTLNGLAKGDKVEVVLEVDWTQLPPHRAASIKKIDAATVLDFSTPRK